MSSFPSFFNHFTAKAADPDETAKRRLLRPVALGLALLALLPMLYAINFTVGGGAPTPEITFLFQNAWTRNGFNNQAVVPLNNVSRLGATGLYQEFSPTAPNPALLTQPPIMALIMPNQNALASNTAVLQVFQDIYAYYTTLGPTTVGMPTSDTLTCPSGGPAACTYQIFTNDYALFAYATPLTNGQDFYLKDPEYTKWISLGGISGPVGFPISVSTPVTASTGTTANQQLFTGGAFYGITSGSNSGAYHAVAAPIYTTYYANLAAAGSLGLPTSDEEILPGGTHQQSFEGGTIQYVVGSTPVVLLPVAAVRVVGPGNLTTALQLNLNQTAQLNALAFTSSGAAVTGRPVTWAVTNTSVLSLTANGATATVTAIGGGNALVTATVNGVSSTALQVSVTAPCCQIGDGAPATVQTAFQSALSRNQLKVALPLPTAAQRVGTGYVQTMTPVGSTQSIIVAEADGSPLAYVVAGPILVAWQNGGGPTGAAGYPTSDSTAGGRQMFTNAAIAGNPAFMVLGPILTKWNTLGYETGSLGLPTAAASTFTTALGEAGTEQPFQNGTIFAITSGQNHGGTYAVSGLILSLYTSLGGPAGAYGAPLGDVTGSGITYSQAFENGSITYNIGDTVAVAHPNPRTPAISASPSSGVPGGRLQLTVSGFSSGATVTVSITNQPSFTVALPLGVFTWNYVIPPSAVAGTVNLQAVDATGVTASGSFSIKSISSLGANLTIAQGNSQSAGVSALLPLPLQVAVKDSSGNPLPGVTVAFNVSPGASISVASAVTDSNGLASTMLRLPSSTGIAIVTAYALGQYVTFGAQAVTTPALNVPKLTATSQNPLGAGTALISQKGATLTAAAMVLAYYQAGGQIGSPNGQATPDTLNKYLSSCGAGCDGFLTNPDTGEQVVNLWRLSGFTGGLTDIAVEPSDIGSIQALAAGGSPVLVFLSLAANGLPVGGSAVVVTGVNSDGSLILNDPNPTLARTNMNDYLNGFQVGSTTWRGTIVSAACVTVQKPLTTSFILAAVSQPTAGGGVSLDVESASGACGGLLEIPDAAVIGSTSSVTLRSSRFIYCGGASSAYQASIGAPGSYRAFIEGAGLDKDLSAASPAAYALTFSTSGALSIAPQATAFTANAVLNAATFAPGIAPGGLFSIFGAGLFGSSANTTVKFGSESATLILKSPFQLNGQVPGDLAPGSYPVTIQSAWGSVTQTVSVSPTSPGIFVVSQETGTTAGNRIVGAVINPDGTLNDLGTPAHRGDVLVVYCTNLGAVQPQGNLYVTVNPVTVVLNSVELPVQYAGLTPGFIGLYQVNVAIPVGTAPGSSLSLTVKAAGAAGNTVNVAIQ